MTRTVWKTLITPLDSLRCHQLPDGAVPIAVALDPSIAREVADDPSVAVVAVWWDVDPTRRYADYTLALTGTGHPVPPEAVHLGSVVAGPFAWHIWRLA